MVLTERVRKYGNECGGEGGTSVTGGHAVEGKSRKAMQRADCAHELAGSAHAAADSAKEDAANAYALALEANGRILRLGGEVKRTEAVSNRNEECYTSLVREVERVAALAKRNQECFLADDRAKGYATPEKRL